uniref:Inositol-tetrakisphosphate 1-kinase 2-like n=1 Tax=Rhizophora mucronata TaxID=61149 RepID=A0A2P2MJF1_RHIMU
MILVNTISGPEASDFENHLCNHYSTIIASESSKLERRDNHFAMTSNEHSTLEKEKQKMFCSPTDQQKSQGCYIPQEIVCTDHRRWFLTPTSYGSSTQHLGTG